MEDSRVDTKSDAKSRDSRAQLDDRQLSDHAYQQRRAMLLVSALTFALSWGGVRVTEINLAGATATAGEEAFLLTFLASVLTYLIGNFATLARPEIYAWRTEVETLKLQLTAVVKQGTDKMRDGIAEVRSVLHSFGDQISDEARAVLEQLDRIDAVTTGDIPKRLNAQIDMHRSRIRFEYQVPIGIGVFVVCATIYRIATAAA